MCLSRISGYEQVIRRRSSSIRGISAPNCSSPYHQSGVEFPYHYRMSSYFTPFEEDATCRPERKLGSDPSTGGALLWNTCYPRYRQLGLKYSPSPPHVLRLYIVFHFPISRPLETGALTRPFAAAVFPPGPAFGRDSVGARKGSLGPVRARAR